MKEFKRNLNNNRKGIDWKEKNNERRKRMKEYSESTKRIADVEIPWPLGGRIERRRY